MAVAVEFAKRMVVPEYPVDAADIKIIDSSDLDECRRQARRVESLLVLAKVDGPDEALVAEIIRLPADGDRRFLDAGEGDLRAVDFGGVGIGDDRKLRLPVCRRIEVIIPDRRDIFKFDQHFEIKEFARFI